MMTYNGSDYQTSLELCWPGACRLPLTECRIPLPLTFLNKLCKFDHYNNTIWWLLCGLEFLTYGIVAVRWFHQYHLSVWSYTQYKCLLSFFVLYSFTIWWSRVHSQNISQSKNDEKNQSVAFCLTILKELYLYFFYFLFFIDEHFIIDTSWLSPKWALIETYA